MDREPPADHAQQARVHLEVLDARVEVRPRDLDQLDAHRAAEGALDALVADALARHLRHAPEDELRAAQAVERPPRRGHRDDHEHREQDHHVVHPAQARARAGRRRGFDRWGARRSSQKATVTENERRHLRGSCA